MGRGHVGEVGDGSGDTLDRKIPNFFFISGLVQGPIGEVGGGQLDPGQTENLDRKFGLS